jgi:hypothetical protein
MKWVILLLILVQKAVRPAEIDLPQQLRHELLLDRLPVMRSYTAASGKV